jgi:MinD-like ATPase involved in chromosome partitioning or flagellar assembly
MAEVAVAEKVMAEVAVAAAVAARESAVAAPHDRPETAPVRPTAMAPAVTKPAPALARPPSPAVAPAATPPTPAIPPAAPAPRAPQVPPERSRPVVTVTGDRSAERPIRMVERALGNPAERRAVGWRDHVVVVPGGHRPGRPDQMQRDRARARLPVPGGCRIVVLGCTVGAGQTMTALLAGEVLASLRDDQVAALDLNPGPGSLAERARAVPPLAGSGPPEPSRLEVVTRESAAAPGDQEDPEDVTNVFELLSARYPLTLADPGAAVVPRVLAAAGQLVLVAPASQDAASALATTREWLEANGHGDLADAAIVVVNGVSRHTMPHVEQAEALARGRCRAIVRVPWDDRLKNHDSERPVSSPPGAPQVSVAGPLSTAALHAYTALAGVLVAAVASVPEQLRARS